jgi:FkbH-like protein
LNRPVAISAKVSEALRANRETIAEALIDSVAHWEKYAPEIARVSRQEFSHRETVAFVDYLTAFFKTGDILYRDLYIGEKLKQCYDPSDTPEHAMVRRRAITVSDKNILLNCTRTLLDDQSLSIFEAELVSLQQILTRSGEKLCRVLLLGDCLYLDLLGFLTAPLLEAGVQLVPTFVTSKLISEQHRELKSLQGNNFDLVFYSPLTYAFHMQFSELQFVRSIYQGSAYHRAVVDAAKRDIKGTLGLLKSTFDCPIFVHNTANIRRYDGTLSDLARTFLTGSTRRRARNAINTWLPEYLEGLNSTSQDIFLLDETPTLKGFSERQVSKTLYSGVLQHPAYFARTLVDSYEDIIVARMNLAKKKLIICDLDNTLWKGIIGEGAVEHYAERQGSLLTLRKKGMLLAVCSKNDPENVHWRGGTLCEEDFVCQQVNWESKSQNIRRIAQRLNLKSKDFIFIDDRADERALVAESMPEIMVLDAESPRTWSQLSALATILGENTDGDRTQAYKQREERERFLNENAKLADGEFKLDESEALKKLKLGLEIRFARPNELGRVAELINRTNQFNMSGTRTSLHEVKRWHDSSLHAILVAEARDKFGSMGTISVAVLEKSSRGLEILAFVLSCRVFGLGMESALINRIKNYLPAAPIYGHFQATAHNGPCHRTYPDNGFVSEGYEWVFRNGESVADASWLTIKEPAELRERRAQGLSAPQTGTRASAQ